MLKLKKETLGWQPAVPVQLELLWSVLAWLRPTGPTFSTVAILSLSS